MKLTSCVLLMVSLVLYSSAVCCKPTIAADVLFQEGSIKLARVHADTLELVACKVKQRGVEVVIVVGHADAREPNPDALSLQRAEVVRDALVREGVELSKVYAEGKGSKQPVSSVAEKAFANRRVELEVIFRSADGPQSDCQLRWNRELRTLGVEHALIVAKTLVRDGGLKSVAPFLIAIEANRPELLEALLKEGFGQALTNPDKALVIRAAAGSKNPALILLVIDAWPNAGLQAALGDAVRQVACTANSVEERIKTIKALLVWGGGKYHAPSQSDDSPLFCLNGKEDMPLVDLLLNSGVDPNQPEDLVVRVGDKRALVDRLLQVGANPLSKSQKYPSGNTLFHTVRLDTKADVDWLLSLGLDINAVNEYGETPLHSAVRYAKSEILDYMLASGVTVLVDKARFLLDGARAKGNWDAFIWLIEHGASLGDDESLWLVGNVDRNAAIPVFSALLKRGVDINRPDSRGETALSVAIERYQSDVVSFLLQHGADPSRAKKGVTALQIAEGLSEYELTPRRRPNENYGNTSAANIPPRISPERQRAKEEIIRVLTRSF